MPTNMMGLVGAGLAGVSGAGGVGTSSEGGSGDELQSRKLFRYLSEEAITNLDLQPELETKCDMMIDKMQQYYAKVKEVHKVDELLKKGDEAAEINVPVFEGTDRRELAITFGLGRYGGFAGFRKGKKGAGKAACRDEPQGGLAPQKLSGQPMAPARQRASTPDGMLRQRWGLQSAGVQSRAPSSGSGPGWVYTEPRRPASGARLRPSTHGTIPARQAQLAAAAQRQRQRQQQLPAAKLRQQVLMAGMSSSRRPASAEPGTPGAGRGRTSILRGGGFTSMFDEKDTVMIELAASLAAESMVEGGGTGGIVEGLTLDAKEVNLLAAQELGRGLRARAAKRRPVVRAVKVPPGAGTQALAAEAAAAAEATAAVVATRRVGAALR